ncbi:ASCH domain-containing protein [Azospirillum sp. TSO5]|uniref:ASCH domain-containing protein n=1 Tax=Azospirillum sp. TSO5 TaxID=716760 RepID=UPI000D614799|nr:ASCH domain-containing protein [Azospirillum sp. TSO5]PWC98020.1 hypothetical protein TSO5_03570 [Azospirillum sp. TSO5]
MRAISLWQPWASLIFAGRKRFETRGYDYPNNLHGSVIAIHAAKKVVPSWMAGDAVCKICMKEFGGFYQSELPHGYVLGTARLVASWPTAGELAPAVSDDERAVGNWFPGRFAWELADITPLPEPIPAKGKQGWWNWEVPNA